MWKMEAHCICSIVKAILILDNSSFLSIACWEDSDRTNEKKGLDLFKAALNYCEQKNIVFR